MTWAAVLLTRLSAASRVALTRTLRPAAQRAGRIAGPLCIVGLAVAMIWTGLEYAGRLAASRAWIAARPDAHRTSQSLEDAFTLARDQNLFRVRSRNGTPQIDTEDCSARLRRPPPPVERDNALKVLCDTPQGSEVVAEIDQWNASFELLALRDNFDMPAKPGPAPCSSDDLRVEFYVPAGCHESRGRWSARLAVDAAPGTELGSRTGAAPFRDYAVVAEERETWMNDWMMVSQAGEDADGRARPVVLTATIPPGIRRAVIQVIGDLRSIAISSDPDSAAARARPVTLDCARLPAVQTFGFDKTTAVVKLLARPDGPTYRRGVSPRSAARASCTALADPGKPGGAGPDSRGRAKPHAYAIVVTTVPDGPRVVRLVVSASRTAPAALVARSEEPEGRLLVIKRTANIAIACRRAGPCRDTDYRFEWMPPPDQAVPHSHPIEIVDRNGTPLLTPAGRITQQAAEANLVPVVGLGAGDAGSLAWALSRASSDLPQRAQLSIDLGLQSLVSKVLREKYGRTEAKPEERPRRAAIVLMDAGGSTTGQIRAMASIPAVQDYYNAWDLSAMLEGNPSWSPLLGHGWRTPDRATTPGSTFKVITALAGIEHVLGDRSDAFQDVIRGTSLANARRLLDIRIIPKDPRRPVDPREAETEAVLVPRGDGDPKCPDPEKCRVVRNFPREEQRLHGAELTAADSGCVPASPSVPRQVGLCEALVTSSNLYFAGLARHLDEDKVMAEPGSFREGTKPTPDLEIAQQARRFSSDGKALSLVPALADPIRRRAYRLLADPLRVAAVTPLAPRRVNVALSGFGQAVSASPLAMATIYGSVAAGHVITPRLTLDAGPAQGAEPPPLLVKGSPGEQRAYLDVLRHGLSGVVFGRAGTVGRNMPDKNSFAGRLFAKTGTADIEGRGNTVWLAGWLAPRTAPAGAALPAGPSSSGAAAAASASQSSPPVGTGTTLAFACMVTDGGGDTGAAVCGPLINAVLVALEGVAPRPPAVRPQPRRPAPQVRR